MSGPVGRPIATRLDPEHPWTREDFRATSDTNLSSARSSSRISARQLDAVAEQMTEIDWQVLSFVADLCLATGTQVARAFFLRGQAPDSEARAARRQLARLSQHRVLDRLPRRVGGRRRGSDSHAYAVGVAGARLLARDGIHIKHMGAPGSRYVRHTLAVAELVVRLREADRAGDLDLIAVAAEPACWRGFIGAHGARIVLKPDLYARVGVGALEDRWFIEVDQATESSTTILAKAQRYVAYYREGSEQRTNDIFPRVAWTVPNERRRVQLEAVLERLPEAARQLFAVWREPEAVTRLIAEAHS
jgi:hypothetical protein